MHISSLINVVNESVTDFFFFYLSLVYCYVICILHLWSNKGQALVVQRVDNAIPQMNHYPIDKCWQNKLHYPLDSDLSGG